MPKTTVHGGASYEPGVQDPNAIAGDDVSRETEQVHPVTHQDNGTLMVENERPEDTTEASSAGDMLEYDAEPVPTGNIQDVLTWVGDDSARAQRALDAERAADAPRTTLVTELEKRAG